MKAVPGAAARRPATGRLYSLSVDRFGLILLLGALATTFLCAYHSLIEEDFWWHLRAGQEIAAGKGIPRVDAYSFPSAGSPYVDLHWLFQWFLGRLHAVIGVDGILLGKALWMAAIFLLVYRLCRPHLSRWACASWIALAAVVSSERFLVRPELATFGFLALAIWLLRRHEEGSRRAWIAIPLLALVWVNCEGLFVLLFLLLVARLAGRPRDRRLWIALSGSIGASLANPYFAHGAIHPFVLYSRISGELPIYSRTIGEFLGPFAPGPAHPAITLFPLYLGLLAMAALLRRRLPGRAEAIEMAAFVYLALSARRNLPLLAIVGTPIAARWLSEAPAVLSRPWVARALRPLLLLAMVAYGVGIVSNGIYNSIGTNRTFGPGIAEVAFPIGAAAFVQEERIEGPIYNDLSAGGYLIHAVPRLPVFIDGRLEVHSTEHYTRYLKIRDGGEAWQEADREHRFGALVLTYVESTGLMMERLADPQWAAVHLDANAIVLLRESAANQETIARRRLTRDSLTGLFPSLDPSRHEGSPPARYLSLLDRLIPTGEHPWKELYLGQLFGILQIPSLAGGQYLLAVRRAPNLAMPRLLLAETLLRLGAPGQARRELSEARKVARTGPEREMAARLSAQAQGR